MSPTGRRSVPSREEDGNKTSLGGSSGNSGSPRGRRKGHGHGAKKKQKRAARSHATLEAAIIEAELFRNATALGSTCGEQDRRARGATGEGGDSPGGDDGTAEEELEEEGDDDGATAEEYRWRANAAAQEMKRWFQKAAEAFARGGR